MDLERMGERLGLEPDELKELVEIFLEASFSDLETLDRAVKDGDSEQVVESAHSIKGAAGNLGLTEIYEAARSMEAQGRKRRLLEAAEGIRSIREELERISNELKAA